MNNAVQYLILAAEAYPERIALIQGDQKISFSQLYEDVLKAVHLFVEKGIGIGDQVLVFVPVSINLYRQVLALFYLGAVPVFIDEWVSLGRLRVCMDCVQCKAIIAPRKLLLLSFFIKKLNTVPVKIEAKEKSVTRTEIAPFNAEENNAALITFTTGTTGIPKAAIRTHGNLLTQFSALSKLLDPSIHTALSTLPIVVFINIGLGRVSILPPKRFKMKRSSLVFNLIAEMRQHEVESIIASPSVFENIIRYTAGKDLAIKELVTGGGSVFPDMAQRMADHYPNAKSQVVFGGTEAEPVSSIDLYSLIGHSEDFILSKGLPVGKIADETNLSIISFSNKEIRKCSDEEWSLLQLPFYSVGEIVVSGRHVVTAYLNNPLAIAGNKILIGDSVWHRTGDIAYRNESNELFYFGRGEQTFKIGEKVCYPMLLEYFIRQKAGILSLAILNVDKELYVFMCRRDKQKKDIVNELLEEQSIWSVQFRFVNHIPKDKRHNTKTNYEVLRKMI